MNNITQNAFVAAFSVLMVTISGCAGIGNMPSPPPEMKMTTDIPETVYASTFLDLKAEGPMIIESPPNVLGILDDMWMRYVGDIGNAGPDKGKGGKFIILPPGFEGQAPDGYHVFHSRTYGVWFLLQGPLVDGKTGQRMVNLYSPVWPGETVFRYSLDSG